MLLFSLQLSSGTFATSVVYSSLPCEIDIYIHIYIYFVGNNYIQSSTVITPTLN